MSPYSVNWECQLADWTDQCAGYPNVDSYPGYAADVTVDALYGQCLFTNVVSDVIRGAGCCYNRRVPGREMF